MSAQIPARVLFVTALRTALAVALLMGAYLVVPIHNDSPASSAVTWAVLLALVLLVGVFLFQARRIYRSRYPLMAAVETLIVILTIFLIGFAIVYLSMSASAPDTFSEPLNRTGAMYFAITVLSTVGFGDITPESDPSRWLVSAQMLIDIGFLAGALRLIFGIARRADARQQDTSTHPDQDTS